MFAGVCRWCAVSSSTRAQINQGLQEDVAASPLLDGALNVVKIRQPYLHVAITAHERLPAQIVQDGVQLLHPVLHELIEPLAALDGEWWRPSPFLKSPRILPLTRRSSTVSSSAASGLSASSASGWGKKSHVAPMNTGRFLNYVLLMLGRFVCENDLLSDGNLHEAFYRARLVTNWPETQADALAIARRYTMEVRRFEPASTK